MWTTSNSRADSLAVTVLACALLACPSEQRPAVAPDAPLPAVAEAPVPEQETETAVSAIMEDGPVELSGAFIRPLGDDDEGFQELAGQTFLATASEPFVVEVEVARPLGNLWQTSAPVIILNGEKLLGTRATSQTTLVAFLENRSRVRGSNTVAVAWTGNLEATMTREPVEVKPSAGKPE